MGAPIALITASILAMLASQAEPATATLGFIWSAVHVYAAIVYWHAKQR